MADVCLQDGTEPLSLTSEGKGKKAQSSLSLEGVWIAEHAGQVAALCTGGKSSTVVPKLQTSAALTWLVQLLTSGSCGQLAEHLRAGVMVIGLYLICPQAAFSKALPQVCKLAAATTALQGLSHVGRPIKERSACAFADTSTKLAY